MSLLFGGQVFAADMQPVTFTDSRDPAPSNGFVDYVVELKNNVPDAAVDAELNVSIPNGFTFVSIDNGNCNYTGNTPSGGATTDRVACAFAAFPGSTSVDINITLRAPIVATSTVFTSTATVTSNVEVNTANDSEIVKTTVVKGADLNLAKTSIPNPVIAGGIVTYRFDVVNNGPHEATSLILTDTLPSGLTFAADNASPSADDDAQWNCSAAGQNVTCVGGDLAVAATSTFYFRAQVTSFTGDIANAATVTSDTLEVNPDDNTDTDVLIVLPGTDMSIVKNVVTNPVIAEQNVTFTLTVTNNGPVAAADVNITDILPAGYTNVIASTAGWTCDVSSNPTITCTRDTTPMGVGVSETITITAQAPNVANIVTHQNSAVVATATEDPITSNDTDTVTYDVNPDQADLSLSKTKSPTPIAVGDTAASVITVRNRGPRPATPVQVVDVLSSNETYNTHNGSNWSCTHSGANGDGTGGSVTCDYALTLAVNGTASALNILTDAMHEGTLENTACTGGSGGSVEPDIEDKNTANDCAAASVSSTDPLGIGIADIRVIKVTDDDTIASNENNFTYTISVKNIDGNTSQAVEFRDTIPQYVSALNGRPATTLSVTTDKPSASCLQTAALVVCQLGDMALNDEVNVTITVARPMADGLRTNTASAYSPITGDPDRSNNEETADVNVLPVADIELQSKLVTPTSVKAGTEATYTIQVRNNGPSTARDIDVTDVFSGKPFTFISANVPGGGSCSFLAPTLTCNLGDLPSGTTRSITVVVRPDHLVPAPANWEINNTASVTMTTLDSNPGNNEKSATLSVLNGEVDLAIEKSESPDFHEPVSFDPNNLPSNLIVYEVQVQNFGPSLATDVNFTDRVVSVSPDVNQNVTFIRDTSNSDGTDDLLPQVCTAPATNPFTPDAAAPTIDCHIDELAANASYTRYLVFHIEDAPHLVSGDVYRDEINVTSREVETLLGNNVEDERTTVRVSTDPKIVKTGPVAPVEVGENFNFTLTVTNNGPGYSPETNIADNLPADMVLTGSPVPTQGSCTGAAGETSFTCNVDESDGTLHSQYGDPGGISEVTITVPVKILVYPAGGTLTNTATVSTTGPDNNESNNEDNATVTVLEPAHIGNRVWHDRNADGIQNETTNLSGVTVELINSLGNVVQTTTTNSSGIYGFDVNSSGDYRVRIVPPVLTPPYRVTTENSASTTDLSDSDINATFETPYETIEYGESNITLDAGLFRVASIGNRVWIDDNGNGIQDSGEANVPDVNVTLYDGNGNQVIADIDGNVFGTGGIITTNASGVYTFANLRPGVYHVEFNKTTLPANYVFTTINASGSTASNNSDANTVTGLTSNTTLISAENDTRWDAGIFIPVSIGDHTWHDANGNGIQDAIETNLANVDVRLFRTAGDVPVTTDLDGGVFPLTTDANGDYLFDNLRPDSYYVRFAAPNATGYVITIQDQETDNNDSDPAGVATATGDTGDYILTSGEDNRSVDAGFYVPIRVGNRVWIDADYNGIQDPGELNVSNVRVTLVRDGVLVPAEFRDTNVSGEYLFNNLAPGYAYSVRFSNLPADYRFTVHDQTVGADDTSDSDANATGYASGQTSITSSADENLTFDAGIYKPVIIGNYIWEDMNVNGIQDGSEPGIDGVMVTLVMDGAVTAVTTTTSGGGAYLFDASYDLKPNHTYSVQFSNLPASVRPYLITTQNAGSDDTVDSDIAALGTTIQGTPTMFSGESNTTLDAGFYRDASMGNRVWYDDNGNGIQDSGEGNVPGVSVELFNTAGVSQGTDITDANGFYHFDNLRPGIYYVVFDKTTLPAGGYVFTQRNAGGNNAVDSDVDLVTGRSETVTLVSNQDDNTTDAGIYIPVSVGDRIWHDENADGIQTVGELNVTESITVDLIDTNDATNTYQTTTSTGAYLFTNVRPGNYHIEFTMPANYDSVSPQDTTGDAADSDVDPATRHTGNFDLVSGVNQMTWDMGVYNTAGIGDRVWIDVNADGIQDATEVGLDGVIVELYKDGVTTGTTTTTAGGGLYAFNNLVPGNYSVKFATLPGTYVLSPQDVADNGTDDTQDSDANTTTFLTETTTLISGENDPTWDAGVYEPASIGNRIWLDTNGNGIQDGTEVNYTDSMTVYLEDENNASVNNASGNAVPAITTSTGIYNFTNLVPGTYHVRFNFPAGTQISPLNTGVLGTDSDVRLDSNTTVNTVLQSGENDLSWDAGVFLHAGLGDQIWIDTNGNGIQDDAQVLDINVTVNLYYANGTFADTQTVLAGGNGLYNFVDVDPNDYYVEFVLPVGYGYQFISPNIGSDDTVDSDVDVSTGCTPTETISSNEFNNTLDAGIYVPASIGDRVWLDANANGIQDPNENNISDINVTLFDDANVSIGTTTTDVNGNYLFSGLVPGDYHVVFSLTDNNGQMYVVSPQDVTTGAEDTNDSDANATGVAAVETLISGEQNLNYDAGLYIPVAIGDFVWSDQDGDGVQDGLEPGIQDVNVTLYKQEDNGTTTTIGSQDTNSTGGYLFSNLVPGNYYVHFDQPDHFRPTSQNSGANDATDSDADVSTGNTAVFELFSPDDNLTLDAGFYALATISGNVSEDTNNDNTGDVNLQFVDIALVDSNGVTVSTAQTDSNGDYIFIDVEPGTYTVVETQPAGLVNVSENEGGADNDPGDSTDNNIIAVIVGIGEDDVNNDFVEEVGVTIGDRVWNDENGDGIQDTTETNTAGLDGIVVNLYNIQDVLVATTTTDSDGEYLFENYPEDEYYVEFDLTTLPAHYGVTQQNQGSDNTNDSDTLIVTGVTGSDYLSPGEDNRTFDMGIYLLGTISGTVLEDINDDDIGDTPMGGITIILYDENGNEIARTVTAADGTYSFTDLPQGVYTIVEVQPDGYLNVGETDGDVPSDGTLNSITVTLDAGEHDGNNDYIEEIGGSIGNYVWNDTNGDGLQDPDESGVNAVQVCLEDDAGNPELDSNGTQRCTETNATGYYLFEGILPGDYVVVFELPSNTTLTPYPQEGSDTAVDSDPLEVVGGFASAPVTMGLGQDILTIDMGIVFLGTASIGNYIWHDQDRDGIQDDEEEGLDGVHVILYDENGTKLEEYITHSGGYYIFEHLDEGHYTVEVILPQDWGFTYEDSDNNDAGDSDVDVQTGRTIEIDLLEGQHQDVWDAGFYCLCGDAANSSDSGDAMNIFSVLAMMLMTGLIGLFFARKEEELQA